MGRYIMLYQVCVVEFCSKVHLRTCTCHKTSHVITTCMGLCHQIGYNSHNSYDIVKTDMRLFKRLNIWEM